MIRIRIWTVGTAALWHVCLVWSKKRPTILTSSCSFWLDWSFAVSRISFSSSILLHARKLSVIHHFTWISRETHKFIDFSRANQNRKQLSWANPNTLLTSAALRAEQLVGCQSRKQIWLGNRCGALPGWKHFRNGREPERQNSSIWIFKEKINSKTWTAR